MRILSGVVVAAAVLLGLTGCSPTPPPIELPPSPSSTPLFASEEEALAAAEEVYGAYSRATDAMGQGGWVDPSHLDEVTTGNLLEKELNSATTLSEQGLRQIGETRFQVASVQSFSNSRPTAVTFYVCVDVSGVDVVDAEGESVVSPEREDVIPLEVSMVEIDAGELRLTESERWPDVEFC